MTNNLHTEYTPRVLCVENLETAKIVNAIGHARATGLGEMLAANTETADKILGLERRNYTCAEEVLVEQRCLLGLCDEEAPGGNEALAACDTTHEAIMAAAEAVVAEATDIDALAKGLDGLTAVALFLVAAHDELNHSIPGIEADCLPPVLDKTLEMPAVGETLEFVLSARIQ